MAELKTKKTEACVEDFLNGIKDEDRRRDCFTVMELMRKATKAKPKMWGTAIVGFGDYHCRYASGRSCEWFVMGFSPRKQNLTLYLMCGAERFPQLMKKLGKHKCGKGCLYINRLDEINMPTLKELLKQAAKNLPKQAW